MEHNYFALILITVLAEKLCHCQCKEKDEYNGPPQTLSNTEELFDVPEVGKQYLINNTFSEWSQANHSCINYFGGQLMRVSTLNDNLLLAEMLLCTDISYLDALWIDFIDKQKHPNFPVGNEHYCTAITSRDLDGYILIKLLCEALRGFVCEKNNKDIVQNSNPKNNSTRRKVIHFDQSEIDKSITFKCHLE